MIHLYNVKKMPYFSLVFVAVSHILCLCLGCISLRQVFKVSYVWKSMEKAQRKVQSDKVPSEGLSLSWSCGYLQ